MVRHGVFVSAVSSEFAGARDAVANDLQPKGLRVAIQRSFHQGQGSTLDKLNGFIAECHAVVAIIGDRSGAFPSEDEAAPYGDLLGPYGLVRASYTQ